MNKLLTWRELKALNEVYTTGSTTARVQQHPYIMHLKEDMGFLSTKLGKSKILLKEKGFDSYYLNNHLSNYCHYFNFLTSRKILNDASRYDEDDIRTLILIEENKIEILKSLTTQRSFSSILFSDKGSKHLATHPGLEKAVLTILGIVSFPDKDPRNNQFRYVVDCKTKKAIVLCENLNFLKLPWKARENHIELWYVGGNNVTTLDHIDKEAINVPIYYSCDWDHDGLLIFQRIKKYIPFIQLLIPYRAITKPVTSRNHFSTWKKGIELSGLDPVSFNSESIELIRKLIINNEWIEEESSDLLELLNQHSI
jgi:hypothetical protein